MSAETLNSPWIPEPDNSTTWQEDVEADEATLKARAWSSDFLAAFRTAQAYFAREYGQELRREYGAEWVKILDHSFKVYAALIDAAGAEESKSEVRRFHLAAWEAQTYLSRTTLPPLSEEDFTRVSGRLSRAWRRYGWSWVEKLQLTTGVALFERASIEFSKNRGKTPAAYTDHFTDLLLATMRKARASRSKRVGKFERAFSECIEEFRQSGLVPSYAPERVAGDRVAGTSGKTTPAHKGSAAEQEPTEEAAGIARRAAARVARIAKALPPDEGDACAFEMLAAIAEEWERATGRPFPVPPVKRADIENPELSESPTSCASPQDAKRNFAAESAKAPLETRPNVSYETPAGEVLEFAAEAEPRGVSLAQAEAAALACASVGIDRVKVIFVDDTKASFDGSCTLAEEVSIGEFQLRLPSYLDRNARTDVESMTVRVRFKGDTQYLQLDDCSPEVMTMLAPFAFLQFLTSPGNGQTFLAFADELTLDGYEDERWRILNGPIKATGANGGAHGSMRWPGSLNRKPKRRYEDGESPRVQLVRAAPGRKVSIAELDDAGLLAAPRQKPTQREVREIKGRLPDGWPDMSERLARFGGDRSRADASWCAAALRRGWPASKVEAELVYISAKAGVRLRDTYARDTVANAAKWLMLGPPSSRESVSSASASPASEHARALAVC
ncbi:MAG: hypothetical protein WCD76_08880 [Pyrinomonadaceae bacterium]